MQKILKWFKIKTKVHDYYGISQKQIRDHLIQGCKYNPEDNIGQINNKFIENIKKHYSECKFT
jgi:hypothetical protein